MTDVKVVAPANMGRGIKWNPDTKQYEVNIGDGLEINEQGQVVAKKVEANPVATQMIDNGSATVIGETYTIDYGNGLIEVNGLLYFPLDTVPREVSDSTAFPHEKDGFFMVCTNSSISYADQSSLYHKESCRRFTASDFGMRSILSINAIAGDLVGYRTETPWIVNNEIFSDQFTLGIHTLAELNQDRVPVMFQIKGIKA